MGSVMYHAMYYNHFNFGVTANTRDVQGSWEIMILYLLMPIIVLIWLPKNIKQYPVKKKLLIGVAMCVLFFSLIALFIILAILARVYGIVDFGVEELP